MHQNLQDAIAELRQKDLRQIQRETAIGWAWRAAAARHLKLEHDAVEYEHEAIEHAALSGDDELLKRLRSIMKV